VVAISGQAAMLATAESAPAPPCCRCAGQALEIAELGDATHYDVIGAKCHGHKVGKRGLCRRCKGQNKKCEKVGFRRRFAVVLLTVLRCRWPFARCGAASLCSFRRRLLSLSTRCRLTSLASRMRAWPGRASPLAIPRRTV
jgi:hypothetical protein